jgi:two-component system chemotaxis sensor kinase CheA
MPNIDAETIEMLKEFVSEAFDSLDTNEPIVEHLSKENNAESVNAIFRVFHTLKGLSGFFEMNVINRVTHEAETLLDLMRKQNKVQPEELISIVYSSFDFLRILLNMVSEQYTDEGGAEEAEDMIIIIKDAISKVQSEEQAPAPVEEEADITPEETFSLEEVAEEESSEPTESDNLTDDLVSDEMLGQFLLDASNLLESIENNLIVLEEEPDNLDIVRKTFGEVHSIKGNAGFMGLGEIEEIAGEMETILDSVRNSEIELNEVIISILLNNLEIITKRLNDISSGNNSQKTEDVATENNEYDNSLDFSEENNESDFEFDEDIDSDTTQIESENLEEESKDIHLEKEPVQAAPKKPEIKQAQKPKVQPTTTSKSFVPQKKDIRVETTKIDKLFDLVGELITIESMVTNNPEIKDLNIESFNKSAGMLNKITREIQEVTMSVRMMPLEGQFNKMKRLVRDVSMKMKKKVKFNVTGQETEMDKNVIDEIADPLVHILRNAIDHGLESPEKREEVGKPAEGTVTLSARYEGNEILIEVEDDGAGIDREKVLNKALERGLINTDPDKMTDSEIFKMIFEPGFSTAKEVTDISGRGVGLDVVKKNIEKLRGTIDIDSTLGKGSVFTLRIPLTLAILEAMIIKIGESYYAIPILSVTESFKVNMDDVSLTMDGLEVVKVRDEIMPVLRLHEIFHDEPKNNDLSEGILIIIETRNKKVCLFADEIVGQQQAVVKSLTDYIGKVPGIMGCLVLGDGGIGLIIDVESLITTAEKIDPELIQKN